VVEEPDVVVLVLQRNDFRGDELVQVGQEGCDVVGHTGQNIGVDDVDQFVNALLAALGLGAARNLTALSGGASRRTWSLDTTGPGTGLILRHDPPGAPDPAGMAKEAACLRAAHDAGVPVPALVDHGDGTGRFPLPYLLMERVDGETIPRRLLRDPALTEVRAALPRALGRILATIHAIDVTGLDAVPAGDAIEDLVRVYRGLDEPRPSVEIGLRWLAEHRPPPGPVALVHGDFRNGNLIVDTSGVRGVLDWELAHLGDPIEDLGWLCVRAWRFGSAEPVGGFGPRSELLRGYADGGGSVPDADTLRWWEAFGTLRWLVLCRVQAERARSGAERSVELTVLGRRVCEQEHDLLAMVCGELPTAEPVEPAVAGGPHDWPSAVEMLDAVRGFLDTELSDVDSRTRFLGKVSANALRIAAREWRLGPPLAERHRARLAGLGYPTEAELALAIRAGELDHRYAEVVDAVRHTVADKLLVANPSY
jgi:aminoglycoside phosphotransferase (APT) family kinase protein